MTTEQELEDKALMFIARNFVEDGEFFCPSMNVCPIECSKCKIKKEVCDILGIE
jgi:hypothetical protein